MNENIKVNPSLDPTRAIPKKYFEPILFLAEAMSSSDGEIVAKEKRMIDDIAKSVGMEGFRHKRTFRELSIEKACEMLNLEIAKKAALIIISLVLKADFERKEDELELFRKIRTMLGTEPITVPVDLGAHKELAMKYLIKK